MKQRTVVDALLHTHGGTYAADAGIRLRDTPSPCTNCSSSPSC